MACNGDGGKCLETLLPYMNENENTPLSLSLTYLARAHIHGALSLAVIVEHSVLSSVYH